MSSELAVYQGQRIMHQGQAGSPFDPQNLDQAIALSTRLAKSGLVPQAFRGKADDILLVIMAGKELGFSTIQSMRSFYVLNGKLGMLADAMVGVCVGKPVCKYFRLAESTARIATYETQREGSVPVRLSYTIEQAVRAKLVSNETYTKHTEAMLRARCSSALARAVYPDFLAGIHDKYELEEIVANERRDGKPYAASLTRIDTPSQVGEPVPLHQETGEVVDYEPSPEATNDFDQGPESETAEPELRMPVNFKKHGGKLLSELPVSDLKFWAEAFQKNADDPSKARFSDDNAKLAAGCRAQLVKRGA